MVSIESATELIQLEHYSSGGANVDYIPTWISTDKRGQSTSIGYWQIGSTEQHGITYSPVYKVIFADLSSVTATHIKVWGISNTTDDAAIFPVAFFKGSVPPNHGNPILDIYLNKFEFTDSVGTVVAPGGTYSIIGCKKKSMPISY
jgi:hypothetical protein